MGSAAFAKPLMGALTAVQQERTVAGTDYSDELASRLAHDPSARHRHNFLSLCQGPDVYDVVRSLIKDPAYWEKEEQHFRHICGLVLDHNELESQKRMKLDEVICPPITTLRSLWHMDQRSLVGTMPSKAASCIEELLS